MAVPRQMGAFPRTDRRGGASRSVEAYRRRLTATTRRQRSRRRAPGRSWEGETITLLPDPATSTGFGDAHFALAFARIENHYFVHKGWMEEAQLLRDAGRLRDIPGTIVQGRYDTATPVRSAWDLHRAWPEAAFHLIPDAGHCL